MKKKSVKIRINGQIWAIKYGDAGKTEGVKNDGICDYSKKTILINRQSSRNLLNVLSHELLHARFPDLEEDAIEEMGTIIEEVYEQMCDIAIIDRCC